MRTETRYFCDFCDKSFPTMEEYKEHETTHLIDYNDKTNEEISSTLKELADKAWDYHVGESVMGMPADNFVSLVFQTHGFGCESFLCLFFSAILGK